MRDFLDGVFDFLTFGWFTLASRLAILFFMVWFGWFPLKALMRAISAFLGF